MKKFILMVAMFTLTFTGNVDAAKIDYANKNMVNRITALSDSLSLGAASDSLYIMNLDEYKTNKISLMFNLDDEQRIMLIDVHKRVSDCFNDLNFISSGVIKERMFNNIINFWRKESYNVFMDGAHYYDEDSRKAFRYYWALVAVTLNNRGITSYGEFVNKTHMALAD